MKIPFQRQLCGLMAALMLFLTAAPALVRAGEIEAQRAKLDALVEKVERKTAEKIFQGLDKVVRSTVEFANKSDRINLKTKMAFLDEGNRIFFDVQGLVRVKVPGERWLRKINEVMESHGTYLLASNGDVAVDMAATPLNIKDREVSFAVQLDLIIQLDDLARTLGESALGYLGALTAGKISHCFLEALDKWDHRIVGKAVGEGVAQLSKLLGDGDEEPFADQPEIASFGLQEVSGAGLLRHFAVAIAHAGVEAGSRLGARTLGAAVAAVLFPTGGAFIPIFLATSAAAWFGHWMVETLIVKLPVLHKFKKLEKLYQQRRMQELERYQEGVVQRLQEEMDRPRERWVFFELMKNFLAEKMTASKGNYDLTPYQPLIERVRDILQYRTINNKDYYAARMYYQFLHAIGQTPTGEKIQYSP